jgi:dTDP-4-dehydrorhamnose 3,5-epimerase
MNLLKVSHCDSIVGLEQITRPEFHDERGSIVRAFSAKELAFTLDRQIKQTLLSKNFHAGTLRGFHWQTPPYADAKLLLALKGSFFIAVLDLNSKTYLNLTSKQISAQKNDSLFIPENCATAYLTLEDNSEILYHLFNDFEPEAARGFIWNDPDVACTWPIKATTISQKDRSLPFLRDVLNLNR